MSDSMTQDLKNGILVLFFCLINVGCATSGIEKISPIIMTNAEFSKIDISQPEEQSFFTDLRAQLWADILSGTTVNGKRIYEEDKKLEGPIFTREQAKEAFKYLCKGGKPRKKVEHQFNYVIPKAPSGIALDFAQENTMKNQKIMRRYASNFYNLMAFGHYATRLQRIPSGDYITGLPYIIGRNINDELINTLKNVSVEPKDFSDSDSFESYLTARRFDLGVAPILFWDREKNGSLYASVVDSELIFQRQLAEIRGASGKKESLEERMVRVSEGNIDVIPYELIAIREHYLLLVSETELEAWEKVQRARNSGLAAELPDNLSSGDSPLKASLLLQKRNKIFKSYLLANVAIKESATADPQIMAYKVSLNTEPLCRLGREDTALISQ